MVPFTLATPVVVRVVLLITSKRAVDDAGCVVVACTRPVPAGTVTVLEASRAVHPSARLVATRICAVAAPDRAVAA